MSDGPIARLADLGLTYREVGATGTTLPDGYRHIGRDVVVGRGAESFHAASRCLVSFDMHRGAGFAVEASADRAATGVDVLLSTGPSWARIEAPCRVIHAVEQPDRHGFTYGTLTGHPMRGEESFSVLLDDDERVRFVLIAFSAPSSLFAKLGGPLGRVVQDRIIDRYARTLATAT
jgi:uncharacterized protein (UPF0548 family)